MHDLLSLWLDLKIYIAFSSHKFLSRLRSMKKGVLKQGKRDFKEKHPILFLNWIKAWVSLMCGILDIYSKFSLFLDILTSNCLFLCKMIFFRQVTRLKWSRDWPRPEFKEIWSFNLQYVNALENSRFFHQNLYLTWLYVVLNGDSENVLFFCQFFQFLPSPSPSPMDIRCNWNKINKSFKPRSIL